MDWFGDIIGAVVGVLLAAAGASVVYGRLQANVEIVKKTAEGAVADAKEIRQELADHKVYVAREFVDRSELDGVAKQFMAAVEALGDRLENGFRHIATRIDAMVDRRNTES